MVRTPRSEGVAAPAPRPPRAAAAPLDHALLNHLLGYSLARAAIATRAAFDAAIGQPLKLRPVEFTILVLLLGNDDVTPKMLSAALAIQPPNLSFLVDRLHDAGWVTRVRSREDRRSQHVRLTPRGAELARRAHRISQSMEDEALRVLSAAERALLFEMLSKVARGA
ncbi:MAG TPA: MarR family transcriptional regulator [Burkholderiaceae bacterium]|nr:MarR family transcriptional regulator [Burkholderiaceae bacterium]